MGLSGLGKLIIFLGLFLVVLGLLLLVWGKLPYIGKLPGDIEIKRPNFTLYFPLVSFLILSLVLTIILNLVFWLWRR